MIFFKRLGAQYASFSSRRPYAAAGLSAMVVLGASDFSAQYISQLNEPGTFKLDRRRWCALVLWGTLFYGGPCRYVYTVYDRIWAKGATAALNKSLADTFLNTFFLVIPSFYITTGMIKGQTFEEACGQLKDEWIEAQFGSILFWLPVCFANFYLIPLHSQILAVTGASFVHKTWLSWLSNRDRGQVTRKTVGQLSLPQEAAGIEFSIPGLILS